MGDRIVRMSTFLSCVLRHEPDALGLSLDPGVRVDVDTLLKRASAEGGALDLTPHEAGHTLPPTDVVWLTDRAPPRILLSPERLGRS